MLRLSFTSALLFLLAGLAGCSGGGANVAGQPPNFGSAGMAAPSAGLDSTSAVNAQSSTTTASVQSTAAVAQNMTAAEAVQSASNATVVAIDAGGSSAGGWSGDGDYSGGAMATVSAAINTSRVSNPAPQSVYRTQRYGDEFSYTISNLASNAAYTVRLHFVESFFTSSGRRAFNITINGNRVLSAFDIFAAAGGPNIAVVKEFRASANGNGQLTIGFSSTTNYASVAGIELLGAAGSSTPAPSPSQAPSSYSRTFPGWAGNRPLPAYPAIAAQSQSMIDTLYWDSPSIEGPSLNDDSEAYYTAKSSDPLHRIHCTDNWGPNGGSCILEGQQIHVPNGAVPAGNTDHHVSILAADGCTLDEMWLAGSLSSATITAAFAAVHNQCTEDGFNTHGGAGTTAGGASNRVGHSTLAELQTGVIHHAIIVLAGCDLTSAYVGQAIFPGQYQACRSGVSGVGVPMGAYFWSDVTPSNLPSGLNNATRMLCVALNKYGGLMDDTNANWYGIKLGAFWAGAGRPGEYPNGAATNDDPAGYAAWFRANAGYDGQVHPASCFPGGDWRHHLHVLAW